MKDPRITASPLCEAHQLIVGLAKEFRITLCDRVGWTESGYIHRIRRNSHLKRLEAEEIASIKRAILTKALETCG